MKRSFSIVLLIFTFLYTPAFSQDTPNAPENSVRVNDHFYLSADNPDSQDRCIRVVKDGWFTNETVWEHCFEDVGIFHYQIVVVDENVTYFWIKPDLEGRFDPYYLFIVRQETQLEEPPYLIQPELWPISDIYVSARNTEAFSPTYNIVEVQTGIANIYQTTTTHELVVPLDLEESMTLTPDKPLTD